jgi:alpha-D-xyloside xylohydrolase
MGKTHSFRSKWLLAFCSFFCFLQAWADEPSYIKTDDGVIVYTDPFFTGASRAVKLVVVSAHIIRVIQAPGKEIFPVQSLITVYPKKKGGSWSLVAGKESLRLITKRLQAVVQLKTGSVSFFDPSGKRLLTGKANDKRSFVPSVFEGQPFYHLEQTFQTPDDDAYYGLGQHQDGIFNYRGEQVSFFQNNTEVAIPFLVSVRNYGLLWDNYSLTKVGDIRPFRPLSALQLFAKKGEEGWLTATYSNDHTKAGQVLLERAESSLDMEFLNDSRMTLPPDFTPAEGVVNWEGEIASDFTGLHKFRLVFGGTIRLWLNDQLVLDRWRKAWNPAPALLSLAMKKGIKVPIRLEWIPEGAESYLSLKWQEPIPEEEKSSFSFSSEAGHQIDYYFIHGNSMDEVIAGYRYLTGKAPIVPRWALGFWQSRERYKTQKEMLDVVAEFRKRRIPLDNIVLDWSYWKEDAWGSQDFDETRFPSPDSMIDVLHNNYHTHVMISVWPKFYEGIPAYTEFEKKGWLYKRNIADRQRDWIGKGYVSTFYDAFNEEARKGFWELIRKKIYTKGIDAWWMDASEPDILSNVSPQKRKQQMTPLASGPSAFYLNAYPLQNAKGIYEGQRSADTNKRVFLLTRSAFAGSQRYAAAVWSGDIGATWQDMKAQIPAGLNFSLSGLPYWTMDIGGFVVESRFEKGREADLEEWRELMTRWYQFGAFVPLFRSHGQFPYREIFNIAPEGHPAYQSMLYYNRLRYRLLPYIYSLAGNAYHGDGTIMRALVMDFPKDSTVHHIGDQYLFGPSLLVSPVYEYKQRRRDLYLPRGQGWYDIYTGKWFAGGQRRSVDAPVGRMPLFVKEGSLLPLGHHLQYTDEKPADTITLYVYTGKNASFSLYEDKGTTYDYEKGQFAIIPLAYEEQAKTLTIGERRGSFPGMQQKRVFRIVTVTPVNAIPLDENYMAKEVLYEGKPVRIKL